MKRRNFLGLVTGAASGSLVVSSGAFNTSRVDREISVDIETDERAYLGLNALPTENEEGDVLERSRNPGYRTKFSFPGASEGDVIRGDGLGTNSEYYFDRLVEVRNQGTDPVVVYSEFSGELGDIALYDSDHDERSLLTNKDRGIELEPGEDFDAGVFIDSADVDPGTTVEDTLTIVGNATETA
ncbi:uncharacterized protein Nmag_1329 [Natrialba magadii ATCC 43099]|uniref:DUF1102 domain-containing protein n=1 Tax=Natrialba magadii (strain ATCC 43099 / DSM 3394 / CCM 3739 / CIP 104546 / IAM 13178 / JCM 8861 / NBRC 102185 / NCIMB 2190 / MS3) TaxID=547559 RepID=D3SSW2_NATMM|nr:DUF1102 domain-containing protein [Natrialba magadii]ADD04908.1 uncharacterized protein Nmag_1329 [Natrialba magadii ATCC 43099]ELY23957.1 hypothetical protein C500_19165 [Natrialba magadii ATCC 43099]